MAMPPIVGVPRLRLVRVLERAVVADELADLPPGERIRNGVSTMLNTNAPAAMRARSRSAHCVLIAGLTRRMLRATAVVEGERLVADRLADLVALAGDEHDVAGCAHATASSMAGAAVELDHAVPRGPDAGHGTRRR